MEFSVCVCVLLLYVSYYYYYYYYYYVSLLLPVTMNIIIDLSNIMYNDLWMWNKLN
jgi:hypothetical protein